MNFPLKPFWLGMAVATLLLHGCSTATLVPANNKKPEVESAAKTTGRLRTEPRPVPRSVSEEAKNSLQRVPDAVIKLNPESENLDQETLSRLQNIAQLLREDERISLRLEGHVPDGGSPSWSIGAAERSLKLVRQRLEELKIPARRIQAASFGEEHNTERDRRLHWVDIYLVRPRK